MRQADQSGRLALISGLYGAVITGCFYGFSVYSKSLKQAFLLSQTQISNVNTLPYLLGLIAPLLGRLAPSKRFALVFGGSVVCALAGGPSRVGGEGPGPRAPR